MARKVLILGESGTGKSHSLKNLDPKSTFVINCDEKDLPFKGSGSSYKHLTSDDGKYDLTKSNSYWSTDPKKIKELMKYISENKPEVKTIVIDTLSMLMVNDFMSSAKIKGYEKYVDLAFNSYSILKECDNLRRDLIIVVLSHVDTENGITDIMVPGGKLLKEKAKPVAMFTVVLQTFVDYKEGGAEYYFTTQNNGNNVVKSPDGMFDKYMIPNDIAYVIEKMNEYYN